VNKNLTIWAHFNRWNNRLTGARLDGGYSVKKGPSKEKNPLSPGKSASGSATARPAAKKPRASHKLTRRNPKHALKGKKLTKYTAGEPTPSPATTKPTGQGFEGTTKDCESLAPPYHVGTHLRK